MTKPKPCSHEWLREHCMYDRERGQLRWAVSLSQRQREGQLLRGTERDDGTYQVEIHRKHYRLHRLVWIYCYGNISRSTFIRHVNGDPTDNRVENLEIGRRTLKQRRSLYPGVYMADDVGLDMTPSQTAERYDPMKDNTHRMEGIESGDSAFPIRWRVRKRYKGKLIHLGYFTSLKKATEVAKNFDSHAGKIPNSEL